MTSCDAQKAGHSGAKQSDIYICKVRLAEFFELNTPT